MKGLPGRVVRPLRRVDLGLKVVAGASGVYLAVVFALRGANSPSQRAWAPWGWLFTSALVAAIYLALFALYKDLDAREEKAEKEAAERQKEAAEREKERAKQDLEQERLDRDIAIQCQTLVAKLSDACPRASLKHLAVRIWRCLGDGEFERNRSWSFFLPYYRPRTDIHWRKGVGVAGLGWQEEKDSVVSLKSLYDELDRLGADEFDRLPEASRYGMSAHQITKTRKYAVISARRLLALDGHDPVAVLVIDYTTTVAAGDLLEVLDDVGGVVEQAMGALESTLLDAGFSAGEVAASSERGQA